ncbi:MAG: F0F1 ATP synthase subunit epsilon [bacterium]
MADGLNLEIITPRERVLDEEVAWVTLPGTEGELGILPEHVPLVTTMASGVLHYATNAGETARVAVHYGYARVQGDRVTVLSDMAERAEDIDLERAREAERKATEALEALAAEEEHRMKKFEAKVRRAVVRQGLKG